MNILQSEIYKKDIKKSILQIVELEKLKKSKILITGATGLVCSAVVDLLISADLQIKVYVAGRNEKKVKDRFEGAVDFVPYDAIKPLKFDVDVDFIIHGASNASPDLYINEPVETMQANINGIQNLLKFAYKKGVKKLIYVSSSEVYGKKDNIEPFKEEQYGFVDILNPRSSYAIAKRAAETMCISYKSEYGVDFNIVRLGHIYGPTLNKSDKRVSSEFSYRAAVGKALVLKSDGKQIRSYCYSLDCASAILSVLTCGISGEAYNISNRNSIISIRKMTEYLAKAGNVEVKLELPSYIEKSAFNPMDNSSLESTKLENLGWSGVFSADEGLAHTVQILKECIG